MCVREGRTKWLVKQDRGSMRNAEDKDHADIRVRVRGRVLEFTRDREAEGDGVRVEALEFGPARTCFRGQPNGEKGFEIWQERTMFGDRLDEFGRWGSFADRGNSLPCRLERESLKREPGN